VAVGVVAGEAEEERPGADAAAVVGERGDLHAVVAGHLLDLGAGDELAQLHAAIVWSGLASIRCAT
jgi:hypothetical protein